jgi:hypothetical protein
MVTIECIAQLVALKNCLEYNAAYISEGIFYGEVGKQES